MRKLDKFSSPYGKPNAPVPNCAARAKPPFWRRKVGLRPDGLLVWLDELVEDAMPSIPTILETLADRHERIRADESARSRRRAEQRRFERQYGEVW